MAAPICENCRFHEAKVNECHRYAPPPIQIDQYHLTTEARWPVVEDDDWCGEFEEAN